MASADLTSEDGIVEYLKSGIYTDAQHPVKAAELEGGSGGFVYRVELENSDQPTIIVKHAEGYAARAQQWKLDTNRMMYESKAMDYLSRPDMQLDKSIRTPKLLFYDDQKHNLFMEDVGSLPSVKGWFKAGVDLGTASKIGQTIGRYLAFIHNSTAGREDVLAIFNGNETAKYLSGTLYFGGLPAAAKKYGYTDQYFQEVATEAQREVQECNDVLTLGDFWTGNVLVDSNNGDLKLYVLDLELSKPGTAEFDIGQMAAEMYCLAAFRHHETGMAMLQSFLKSYKDTRNVAVDAGKVGIRIAAHLIVMVPGIWSSEDPQQRMKDAIQLGADLIRMAWDHDMNGLRKSIVGSLL